VSSDSGLSELSEPLLRPAEHQAAETRNRAVIGQPKIARLRDADLHHHRLDEDLATRHIEPPNHIAQRQEVLARRQDHQRVGRFVRRDLDLVLECAATALPSGARLRWRAEAPPEFGPDSLPTETEIPSPPSTCTMSSALAFSSA
jgi:hypothetical protein